MRKKLILCFMIVLGVFVMAACNKDSENKSENGKEDKKVTSVPDADDIEDGDTADSSKADEKKTTGKPKPTEKTVKTDDKQSKQNEPDTSATESELNPRQIKACEAYGKYLTDYLAAKAELAEGVRFDTGFIDEDDIPELYISDVVDQNIRLYCYDEEKDSVVELGVYDCSGNNIFSVFSRSNRILYVHMEDSVSQEIVVQFFDGNTLETEWAVQHNIETDEYSSNGEPLATAAVLLKLGEYEGYSESTRMVDYIFEYDVDAKKTIVEQLTEITDWTGKYNLKNEYTDNIIRKIMKPFKLDWSLNGVEFYDFISQESTFINPFQCKAHFSVNKEGEYKFDFNYQDISFSQDSINSWQILPLRMSNPESNDGWIIVGLTDDNTLEVDIQQVDWNTIYVIYYPMTEGQCNGAYYVQFTK